MSLSLKGEQSTFKIFDPRWETIDSRLFLVGRWPDPPAQPESLAGIVAAVSWDQVNHFVVFASQDDFSRRLGDSREVSTEERRVLQ